MRTGRKLCFFLRWNCYELQGMERESPQQKHRIYDRCEGSDDGTSASHEWFGGSSFGGSCVGSFVSGSTIITSLHDKINPKDCQVLSLGDSGFLQFFLVVSSDYGKPRFCMLVWKTLEAIALLQSLGINRHILSWWARGVQSPPKNSIYVPLPFSQGDWIPREWQHPVFSYRCLHNASWVPFQKSGRYSSQVLELSQLRLPAQNVNMHPSR